MLPNGESRDRDRAIKVQDVGILDNTSGLSPTRAEMSKPFVDEGVPIVYVQHRHIPTVRQPAQGGIEWRLSGMRADDRSAQRYGGKLQGGKHILT